MDNMLGRLAKFFRNLGIDTEFVKEKNYEQLEYLSKTEERIIITRDKNFFGKKINLPCFMPASKHCEGL